MGADFHSDFIKDPELKMTNAQLATAAFDVFDQSAHEFGHGGHTGTLAEKSGITIRSKVCKTTNEALAYIEELESDKWENADVVAVEGKGWVIGGWCSS